MSIPNRYETLVTVHYSEAEAMPPTHAYYEFSDLQMAYLWIINYVEERQIEHPDEVWNCNGLQIPAFVHAADSLDNSVAIYGVREGKVEIADNGNYGFEIQYGRIRF